VCRGFKSLLRYHLSPHSTYFVRVGLFAEKGVQSPGDLDDDTPRTRSIPRDRDGVDQIPDGLGSLGITSADAGGIPDPVSETAMVTCSRGAESRDRVGCLFRARTSIPESDRE
jgi:hypothetical protein